ncbi:hypothetical protein VIGAN_11047300, partial [Vigna angularis var. angularis]
LNFKDVEIYTKIVKNLYMFLENRNYPAAYKESCCYSECLKAIPKGFTFDRGSRDSVCACLVRCSVSFSRRTLIPL